MEPHISEVLEEEIPLIEAMYESDNCFRRDGDIITVLGIPLLGLGQESSELFVKATLKVDISRSVGMDQRVKVTDYFGLSEKQSEEAPLFSAVQGFFDRLTELNSEAGGDCPICLLALTGSSEAQEDICRLEQCWHLHHKSCLAEWWACNFDTACDALEEEIKEERVRPTPVGVLECMEKKDKQPPALCAVCREEASVEDVQALGMSRKHAKLRDLRTELAFLRQRGDGKEEVRGKGKGGRGKGRGGEREEEGSATSEKNRVRFSLLPGSGVTPEELADVDFKHWLHATFPSSTVIYYAGRKQGGGRPKLKPGKSSSDPPSPPLPPSPPRGFVDFETGREALSASVEFNGKEVRLLDLAPGGRRKEEEGKTVVLSCVFALDESTA